MRAQAAAAEWRAGGDPQALAETYGPANYDTGWITRGDIGDAAWEDAIFTLEVGQVTDAFEAATGEQLIGKVTDIVPARADEGFTQAVNAQVGEEVHRRNVELEATAAKLKDQITQEAVTAEYEQVKLAEIFIEADPYVDPDNDQGDVRASHILYQPETPLDADGNPTPVADSARRRSRLGGRSQEGRRDRAPGTQYRGRRCSSGCLRQARPPRQRRYRQRRAWRRPGLLHA